jgi:hypothetical protein
MGQAGDDAVGHRISRGHDHDRNARRRVLGGQGAGIRAGQDDVDAVLDERGGEPRESIGLALGKPADEREALPLDPAEALQPLAKRARERGVALGRRG